jgi:hypothetical protein
VDSNVIFYLCTYKHIILIIRFSRLELKVRLQLLRLSHAENVRAANSPPRSSTLKKAVPKFAETLENFQHSMWAIPES